MDKIIATKEYTNSYYDEIFHFKLDVYENRQYNITFQNKTRVKEAVTLKFAAYDIASTLSVFYHFDFGKDKMTSKMVYDYIIMSNQYPEFTKAPFFRRTRIDNVTNDDLEWLANQDNELIHDAEVWMWCDHQMNIIIHGTYITNSHSQFSFGRRIGEYDTSGDYLWIIRKQLEFNTLEYRKYLYKWILDNIIDFYSPAYLNELENITRIINKFISESLRKLIIEYVVS